MISSVCWRAGRSCTVGLNRCRVCCTGRDLRWRSPPALSQAQLPPMTAAQRGQMWTLASAAAAAQGTDSLPLHYRLLALDTAFTAELSWRRPRPRLGRQRAAAAPVELALPMPQGGFQHFAVETSPVMAPTLAAQFPDIQTYRGHGVDDPTATVRLGLTAQGFHAVILSAADTVYITHYGAAGSPLYLSYFASDYPADETFVCGVRDDEHAIGDAAAASTDAGLRDELSGLRTALASGPDLRTYRLAVAATGEYSAAAIAGAGLINPTERPKDRRGAGYDRGPRQHGQRHLRTRGVDPFQSRCR